MVDTTITVDINEDDIFNYGKSIFNILLKDRTTNKNIIWATDDYTKYGALYEAHCEIDIALITGINTNIIQPRITKSQKKQNDRTKEKAEVFTPLWVCNEQNNLVDERWFGRKNVFNVSHHKSWSSTTENIIFTKKRGWKDYIDARRMEISCGEAPYLVSRYDTITGETIKLKDRIGLLDRKIRVVNENTKTESEWLKWVERAFQSIYGFEFQGDNLLLARENLLFTFIENLQFRFNRNPTERELKKIATIISWNIWQMDGILFMPPYNDIAKEECQLTLFEENGTYKDNKKSKNCIIKDWRSKKIIEYRSLLEIY
jgi:hypothetical protein